MLNLAFVGDIMLGRFVSDKYSKHPYDVISKEIIGELEDADSCIANLESPVLEQESDNSLKFAGNPSLLERFRWVSCFSLSNNHINDFGTTGMSDTIKNLEQYNISHNGLYQNEYKPFVISHNGEKVAVITCTDMMNHEFSDDCPYRTLRMGEPDRIFKTIGDCKSEGYFTVVFLHAGMLFSRYLNPVVREFAHKSIDCGANAVITTHSHCLGGYEMYKDSLIFNSLGDFLMDGSSFRRREACILKMVIDNGKLYKWDIRPVVTDIGLTTKFPEKTQSERMKADVGKVAQKIRKNSHDYAHFYKKQYKVEMLQHSLSTVRFELKTRGLRGVVRILWIRIQDVKGMIKRIFTDRSKMSCDSDAVRGYSNEKIK